MKYLRNLCAVLAALSLFGAQQAAFAHWAAHLGAPAAVALEAPDAEHANAAALTLLCAGCLAFAGVDAALPSAAVAPAVQAAADTPLTSRPRAATIAATRHFDSRAPPTAP
jgi:hypothetical protein